MGARSASSSITKPLPRKRSWCRRRRLLRHWPSPCPTLSLPVRAAGGPSRRARHLGLETTPSKLIRRRTSGAAHGSIRGVRCHPPVLRAGAAWPRWSCCRCFPPPPWRRPRRRPDRQPRKVRYRSISTSSPSSSISRVARSNRASAPASTNSAATRSTPNRKVTTHRSTNCCCRLPESLRIRSGSSTCAATTRTCNSASTACNCPRESMSSARRWRPGWPIRSR